MPFNRCLTPSTLARTGKTAFYVLLFVFFLPLTLGYILSCFFTRRHKLGETRSPAEYGLAFEEVSFPARDGLILRGWWIPAPGSDRAVILMHGHGGSMDLDVERIPWLHAAGFNLLMFDFRAHGRSKGQVCTVGYLERQDALGAVDFVSKIPRGQGKGIERIGLLGFSMGGIVAMLTAPICPHVRAIVSDGGPARLRNALVAWCEERGIPRWLGVPLSRLILAVTSLRVGANQFHYEPVRWVGKIAPRPILFIHGDLDQYVPPADFDALVAAAGPTAEVWRVPEAGHTMVSQMYPEKYQRLIVAFFDRNL